MLFYVSYEIVLGTPMPAQIQMLDVARLRAWPKNARTHSKKQIRQIAESIERFGFTNPVLVDAENLVLAGHGRIAAAKLLGMDEVPCIRIETMTAEEKRAYVIADNKLTLNAGWDEDLLAEELKALSELDLDFDLTLTGFTLPEIDGLIEGCGRDEPGNPEDDRLPIRVEARCKPGDIWQMGSHRLICGDARERQTVDALMGEERAEMVFTDPPYNVRIDGNVGGLGTIKHRDFAMASGEMTQLEFTEFLTASFQNLVSYSLDGSIHFVCMDWRHIDETLGAAKVTYTELKNLNIWVKDNGGMGTFYRSRH
jgi:ParB-like nuclease family protein